MLRSRFWSICTLALFLIISVSCQTRGPGQQSETGTEPVGIPSTIQADTGAAGTSAPVLSSPTSTREPVETTEGTSAGATPTSNQLLPTAESGATPDTLTAASVTPVPTQNSLPPIEIPAEVDGHPRLFFEVTDIEELRDKAANSHREVASSIRDYVQSQIDSTPTTTVASEQQVETYRTFGSQLIPFSFACALTQNERFCGLAKSYLLTFASWDQWGEDNQRGLGLAHMLMGNAIAYDWLYSSLTPEERQIVSQSLGEWAQKMYEASAATEYVEPWNNWWRNGFMQNHYMVTNSALGMAGLALLGEDERAQMWIDHASERMSRHQAFLNGIEDGTWHEGMNYQGYMLASSLPFLISLRQLQGTDLLPHEYLQNYANWRVYNFLPGTSQFIMAFGDIDWDFLGFRTQNVLRFIANEYHDGLAEWMAQQLHTTDDRRPDGRSSAWYVFEFLYYDPSVTAQPPTTLPGARLFPDLEAVIWRTGWQADDLVFALKAGPYGGRFAFDTFTQQIAPWEAPCPESQCHFSKGHDHDDANTFYLYGADGWLAAENAEYGNSETRFHNTLLIDGQGQFRPRTSEGGNPEAFVGSDGYIEGMANSEGYNYVAADATGPYRQLGDLSDNTRHVLFVRPDYLLMVDHLAAASPHRYEWLSHFPGGVEVEGAWVEGQGQGAGRLGIQVLAPTDFVAETGTDGMAYVRIRSEAANSRLVHLLVPTDEAAWASRPQGTLVEDNGQALLVAVSHSDGGQDTLLLAYGQGGQQAVGGYETDGRVAVVRRGSAGELVGLFLSQGSFLGEVGQEALLSGVSPQAPFEARYEGSDVVVSGALAGQVRLYAPQAQQLTLNGQPAPFSRQDDFILFGEPIGAGEPGDDDEPGDDGEPGNDGGPTDDNATPPFAFLPIFK